MKRRFVLPAAAAGLLALSLLAGCAGQNKMSEAWWGDSETGVLLRYDMPEGKPLAYELTNESDQHMEVMGQNNEISTTQTLAFSLIPDAPKDGSQKLEITIEDMGMTIVSAQGTISPPMGELVGRSFEMAVSNTGTEIGCEAAADLSYKILQEERDLTTEFCAFFPDLPEEPVRVGDTWKSTSNVEPSSGGGGSSLEIDLVNTLTGFETVGGHECARIESEFTGLMAASGTQGPATFKVTGDMEGSSTWHFAYTEGFVVDDFTMGTGDGEIVVTGAQEMTIPTKREFTFETRLLEPGMNAGAAMTSDPPKEPVAKTDATAVREPGDDALKPPIVVTAGPFTVMGVPRRFESTQDAETADFDELWMNEFMPYHDVLLPISTNEKYYGVSYGTGEGESLYYLAGMAVVDEVPTPEGLTKYVVPEATYAVFETDMAGIGKTWDRVFEDWLPRSGYQYDWEAPSYEEYPPDADETSTVLLYVPITETEPR